MRSAIFASITSKILCGSLFLAITFLLMEGKPAMAMGEKYIEQGNLLSKALDKELINRGICKDVTDCQNKVPMYGGHGNQVNFTVYKPDQKALAATFDFLIMHGIEITKGVAISIRVYPKSREEYGNVIWPLNPTISLEIKE